MEPFQSYPNLTTHRLTIRYPEHADAEKLSKLRSHPEVNRYLSRKDKTTLPEAEEFIQKISEGIFEGKWLYWAIILKETQELIGTVCVWQFSDDMKQAEIGYELHPDSQGKGYMSECLKCIIYFSLNTIGLKVLDAYTHFQNKASIRLLKKFGFQLEPDLQDEENPDNRIYQLKK